MGCTMPGSPHALTTTAYLVTVVIYSRKKFINLPLEFSAVKSFFLVADARDNYASAFALGKVFQDSLIPLSKTWLRVENYKLRTLLTNNRRGMKKPATDKHSILFCTGNTNEKKKILKDFLVTPRHKA